MIGGGDMSWLRKVSYHLDAWRLERRRWKEENERLKAEYRAARKAGKAHEQPGPPPTPFALLPWGIGPALELLPFGSLAGAPLAVFAGIADPYRVIALQALWNLALWPLAMLAFCGSRERMVSYGG